MWIRGYISTCFGCPYEGKVAPEKVVEVAERLRALGCDELSVGDTIGVAVPAQAADVMGRLRDRLGADVLAVHFHDTRGTALANVLAALQEGILIVDSSAGGLGGCPYAPGASGNLATEDLLYMLHGSGVATGVDLEKVVAASRAVAERLGRALPSRYLQASATPRASSPPAARS
jgi:isopropylmalate/homocitrate/citramalate synthase